MLSTRHAILAAACALALSMGLHASEARAAEVVGQTSATLEWPPSGGPVIAYGVWVARNGAAFPEAPEQTVPEARAVVGGAFGDSIVVRVAGFDAAGSRSPFSVASEPIQFVASPEPEPDPEPDPEPEPEPEPAPGAGLRAAAADFDGDGRTDLLWSGADGSNALWLSTGSDTLAAPLPPSDPRFEPAASGDFDGDGDADVLWRDPASGEHAVWILEGGELATSWPLAPMDPSWLLVGTLDLDLDGTDELLWQSPDASDTLEAWSLRDGRLDVTQLWFGGLGGWVATATGDHDGDGATDVYWREPVSGANRATTQLADRNNPFKLNLPSVDAGWELAGIADLDGDGMSDVVWHEPDTGERLVWLHDGTQPELVRDALREEPLELVDGGWTLLGTGDFDGDGREDLFWKDETTGETQVWRMDGAAVLEKVVLGEP